MAKELSQELGVGGERCFIREVTHLARQVIDVLRGLRDEEAQILLEVFFHRAAITPPRAA